MTIKADNFPSELILVLASFQYQFKKSSNTVYLATSITFLQPKYLH